MEKVGVEAVVEGLSAFISDTGKINKAIQDIRPNGTLLQRMFEGVGNAMSAFGREVLNVAEYALGHLLADAIQFIIGKIGDLIGATIEAGSEFQTLELRLKRLNFNTLLESGVEFNEAMKQAISLTRDQLSWITKLAATTPYDAADIANVFTLARSYGFAADAAKGLTQDITNFASGMGLGNTEIERIIINFGQMVQQGKVTQREMNDLARGAFVPVNDVIKRMQENVGLTGKAFDKFKLSGEGVNAFMVAFSQLVQERFQGAANDMAKTFQGATANAQDFVKSIFGLNTVKPVLDVIGGKIAAIITGLTEPGKMVQLQKWAGVLGTAFAGLLSDILGIGKVDPETIFAGLIKGIQKIIIFITTNKDKIVGFFRSIGDAIRDRVIPFVLRIVDNFNKIRDWVNENRETINKFFGALGEIIAKVFDIDTSKLGSLDGVLDGILVFMQYVIDNKDAIAEWAAIILKAFIAWQILATILNVVLGILLSIVGWILGVVSAVAGFMSIVSVINGVLAIFGTALGGVVSMIGTIIVVIAAVVASIALAIGFFGMWRDMAVGAIGIIIEHFHALWANVVMTVTNVINSLKQGDWLGAGLAIIEGIANGWKIGWETFKALVRNVIDSIKLAFTSENWGTIGRGIIEGVQHGVMKAADALIAAVTAVIKKALQAARNAASIKSPSREGIYIGEMTIMGIVKGIQENASLAARAMQNAMAMISAPMFALPAISQQVAVAAPASVNNNTSYTNNMTLNIASRAPIEPLVQDYNMLKSIIGA